MALQGTLDRILREERDEAVLLRRVAEALSKTAALDPGEPVVLMIGEITIDSGAAGPVPMAVVVDGEHAAVLRLQPRRADAAWHARWDGFLESVANQTSLSLHRLRAEREIERMNAVLVVARDEALEASRIKTAFLANMSHEFRTPMNAIIGYSEMLIEDADQLAPEEMLPDLRRIHASGKHLLALIDDILDLSKIEAGRMTVLSETFDPAATIRDLATNLMPIVARNGNRLDIGTVAEIGTASTDSVKFRQVLTNLIGNAAKFTENGRVSVSLASPRAGWMRVEVADTGIGMSADQIARLFRPFVQADPSTTRKYGGT
ncbi:MAG: sensor histidine kinase, partial [Armatimonadota bacterium]